MYNYCYICKNILTMEIVKRTRNERIADISHLKKAKDFFFDNYNPKEKINKKQTALALGVSRVTIYNWIKEIENN